MSKEDFYKYGESLGIKINDLQRLKMLACAEQNEKLIIELEESKPYDLSKETLDELFSLHDSEDFISEKDEKLIIELEERDYKFGDGCCCNYGTDIYINGKKIECEDGTSVEQLLKVVLNKLGYKDVTVRYK